MWFAAADPPSPHPNQQKSVFPVSHTDFCYNGEVIANNPCYLLETKSLRERNSKRFFTSRAKRCSPKP